MMEIIGAGVFKDLRGENGFVDVQVEGTSPGGGVVADDVGQFVQTADGIQSDGRWPLGPSDHGHLFKQLGHVVLSPGGQQDGDVVPRLSVLHLLEIGGGFRQREGFFNVRAGNLAPRDVLPFSQYLPLVDEHLVAEFVGQSDLEIRFVQGDPGCFLKIGVEEGFVDTDETVGVMVFEEMG